MASPASPDSVPTDDQIRQIVSRAADAPLATNTEILDAYFHISTALGRLLHQDGSQKNATFATFAAWSAQSLRADLSDDDGSEAPRGRSLTGIARSPARWLYDTVTAAVMNDPGAIARNIALGQAGIFVEIGTALAGFVDMFATDDGPAAVDDEAWDQYAATQQARCAVVDPDDGKPVLETGDVALMLGAVRPYFVALGEHDPKRLAELILLGNVRFLAYEQKRLQPVLDRNLALLPSALRLRVVTEWFGRNNLRTRAATRGLELASPYLPLVEEAFQIAATRHVYRMILGKEVLRFGVDVPLPPPAHPLLREDELAEDKQRYSDGDFFPYELQTLEHPSLWAAWQQYDRSFGQGERTAVDNWLRLPERLNYVVNVFRSRQQVSALYDRPPAAPVPAPRVPPTVLGPVRGAATMDQLAQVRLMVDDVTTRAHRRGKGMRL